MGACYSVSIKVKLTNEEAAVRALNDHMATDKHACYSLDKYAAIGITPDTFDGLMKILLAEHQHEITISTKGTFRCYENDFSASYGWESVMIEWFDVLSPFLANGSQLLIYPDSDYDKIVIKNGMCVQVH